MATKKNILDHPCVARVEAYALLWEGQPCGKCIIAYPADGAGIVKASIVAWEGPLKSDKLNFGLIGTAGGYGYDKSIAAIENLLRKAGIECPSKGWREDELFKHFGYESFQVL